MIECCYSRKQMSMNTWTHAHIGPQWLVDPKGTLSSPYPPCHIVMPHFSQHKKDDDQWYSQPFYSSPGGYKLRLYVFANGYGDAKGTHITIFINLMRGENDNHLQWPFEHHVTYGILNWKRDENHVIYTTDFKTASTTSKDRVRAGEKAHTGYGHGKVLSHASLYDSENQHIQYLYEDCLCVQVLKVEAPK